MNAYEYELQSVILDAPDPEHVDPKIREQVTAYEKLVEDWTEARNALYAAEDNIVRAGDADAEALATAIKAGKPDPGERHWDAAVETHRQAARRMAALHRVWFEADRALEPVLRKHAQYTADLAATEGATALGAYEDAITQAEKIMDAAAAQLEQAVSLAGLAHRLADAHELIGYENTVYVQRTNLVEARGYALRLKRGQR